MSKCRAEGKRRLRGMEGTIDEALAQEQAQFLPLPPHPYRCCTVRPARANGFGLVTFQTNRYSVPADHAHKALWLRAYVDRVEVSNGRQTLAVHARCYKREQDTLNRLPPGGKQPTTQWNSSQIEVSAVSPSRYPRSVDYN